MRRSFKEAFFKADTAATNYPQNQHQHRATIQTIPVTHDGSATICSSRRLRNSALPVLLFALFFVISFWAQIDRLDESWPSNYMPEISIDSFAGKTTVYHLGWDQRFGQTNNQLVTILHALDYAWDENGGKDAGISDGCNRSTSSRFVIALSGWALMTLNMFLSETMPIESNSNLNWTKRLEQHLPFVKFDELDNISGEHEDIALGSGEMYYYTRRKYQDTASFSRLEKRRRSVLGTLLSLVPGNNLEPYSILAYYLKSHNYSQNYVTIHVRFLDGECVMRVGQRLPPHECLMPPAYIKDLLRPHFDDLSRVPIVVISDLQWQVPLRMLKEDPEIGKNVIIPQQRFPIVRHTVVSDMMIAARSQLFIGPRVSSMTVIIGQMRVALGADPQTNLVFVRERENSSVVGEFDVFGECIFYCNHSNSDICGELPVYA